jgi:hypothetical protein
VAKTTAVQDQQLLDAARKLIETLDPDGGRSGKYQVQFEGTTQGAIVGDHAQQTNTFGTPPTWTTSQSARAADGV